MGLVIWDCRGSQTTAIRPRFNPDRFAALDSDYGHLYGRSWREGRKLCHVTVLSDDRETMLSRTVEAMAAITGEPVPGLPA